MGKIYKGWELIKAIADGEIKKGSRFIDTYSEYIYKKDGIDAELTLYKKDEITGAYSTPDYSYFVDNENEFELIEEDAIDIDNISELYSASDTDDKINELVQAVKQLNKEIKELKSKEYCQVCGVELTEKNKYMKGMCYDCKYGEE